MRSTVELYQRIRAILYEMHWIFSGLIVILGYSSVLGSSEVGYSKFYCISFHCVFCDNNLNF